MASINASTSGAGGLISTADATGNLSLQSGGTTVVALTSAGAAVTGTLSATGAANLSNTLTVTGDLSFNSGYGSAAVAYGCRAWVNFNGSGTPAIRASGNVSSITDNGTGYYTVNFTNALPDANYTSVVGAASTSSTTNAWVFTSPSQAIVTPTTSAFTVLTNNLTNSAQIDATYITVAVFR